MESEVSSSILRGIGYRPYSGSSPGLSGHRAVTLDNDSDKIKHFKMGKDPQRVRVGATSGPRRLVYFLGGKFFPKKTPLSGLAYDKFFFVMVVLYIGMVTE